MAELVYGIAWAITDFTEKISTLRSPVIPQWTTPFIDPVPGAGLFDDHDAPKVLTEHRLHLVHHTWATRHAALHLRLCCLWDAKSKGMRACWAGTVNRETLQTTKDAVAEAKWVEDRLAQAVAWCEGRKVRKLKLVKLVKIRKGRASTTTRPTYTETPPSLLDLPYPLPLAPSSNRLAQTIPRPPTLTRETAFEEEERTRPPVYTEEADLALGEESVMGGMWHDPNEVRAYEAAFVDEDDDVLRMLEIHQHPRTS